MAQRFCEVKYHQKVIYIFPGMRPGGHDSYHISGVFHSTYDEKHYVPAGGERGMGAAFAVVIAAQCCWNTFALCLRLGRGLSFEESRRLLEKLRRYIPIALEPSVVALVLQERGEAWCDTSRSMAKGKDPYKNKTKR
jgi:hypothetical protein